MTEEELLAASKRERDAGGWEACLRVLEAGVEEHPESWRMRVECAKALFALHEERPAGLRVAEGHLQTAIGRAPDEDDPRMWLGIVLSARIKVGGPDRGAPDAIDIAERAERALYEALARTDQPSIVHMVLAEHLLWPTSRYGEAEDHFLEAIRLEPQNWIARLSYADMLGLHGRFTEAREQLRLARENAEEGRLLWGTMRRLDDEEAHPESARERIEHCLRIDPTYARAREAPELRDSGRS